MLSQSSEITLEVKIYTAEKLIFMKGAWHLKD